MFGKLVKYEMKAYKKPILICSLVLGIVTLIGMLSFFCLGYTINNSGDDDWQNVTAVLGYIVLIATLYITFIGYFLASIIVMSVRFYKTMFSDQGYLTHTLPVTGNQLILSKFFSSFIYNVIMSVSILISIILLVFSIISQLPPDVIYDLFHGFSEVFQELSEIENLAIIIPYALYYFAFMLITSCTSILIIYACISLGQLWKSHRILGAILFYFAYYIIQSIINFIVQILSIAFSSINDIDKSLYTFSYYNAYIGLLSAIYLTLGIVAYFITKHQITKNLNLQ